MRKLQINPFWPLPDLRFCIIPNLGNSVEYSFQIPGHCGSDFTMKIASRLPIERGIGRGGRESFLAKKGWKFCKKEFPHEEIFPGQICISV